MREIICLQLFRRSPVDLADEKVTSVTLAQFFASSPDGKGKIYVLVIVHRGFKV
jgi:hypothetical protein